MNLFLTNLEQAMSTADGIAKFFSMDKIEEFLVQFAFDIFTVIAIIIVLSIVRRIGKNIIKRAFAVNIDKLQKMTGGTNRRKESCFKYLALYD